MKKLLALLTLLGLLLSLCMLVPSAEDGGNVTVDYGREKVELTLIDPLNDANRTIDGSYGLGKAMLGDGKMLIETNSMFDVYGMTTDAVANVNWSNMKYVVLSVENTSDGDVYFCFQPTDPEGANIFLSAPLAKENPIKLVDSNGTAKDAKFSASKAVSGRDAMIIPYRFSGYIFIPVGILADLNNQGTPSYVDDAGPKDYGFHAAPDDASYVELTILDVYACGELPVYQAAETTAPQTTEIPTEVPTEAPTEIPTEAPTEAPEETSAAIATDTDVEVATTAATATATATTEELTDVSTAESTATQPAETMIAVPVAAQTTAGATEVATEVDTIAPKPGCTSVLGLLSVLPLTVMAVGMLLIRKKK